jgi:hypothetical protein
MDELGMTGGGGENADDLILFILPFGLPRFFFTTTSLVL